MKSVLAIIGVIVVSLILIFFYLGKALEALPGDGGGLSPLKSFRGPTGPTPSSTIISSPTFSPPVFVGPFAKPQIIGPKGNPPPPSPNP